MFQTFRPLSLLRSRTTEIRGGDLARQRTPLASARTSTASIDLTFYAFYVHTHACAYVVRPAPFIPVRLGNTVISFRGTSSAKGLARHIYFSRCIYAPPTRIHNHTFDTYTENAPKVHKYVEVKTWQLKPRCKTRCVKHWNAGQN